MLVSARFPALVRSRFKRLFAASPTPGEKDNEPKGKLTLKTTQNKTTTESISMKR